MPKIDEATMQILEHLKRAFSMDDLYGVAERAFGLTEQGVTNILSALVDDIVELNPDTNIIQWAQLMENMVAHEGYSYFIVTILTDVYILEHWIDRNWKTVSDYNWDRIVEEVIDSGAIDDYCAEHAAEYAEARMERY